MYNTTGTTGRLAWFACQCKYNSVQWSIQELTPRIVAMPLIYQVKKKRAAFKLVVRNSALLKVVIY